MGIWQEFFEQREPIGHPEGPKGREADAHQPPCGQRHRSRAMGNGFNVTKWREQAALTFLCAHVEWSRVEGLKRNSEISLNKIHSLKIPRKKKTHSK